MTGELPGPGLDLPVDVTGDGVSTFGDRYAFNYWLELGGDLETALAAAKVGETTIDLSDFFKSSDAQIEPQWSVTETEVQASSSGGSCDLPCGGGTPPPDCSTSAVIDPQFCAPEMPAHLVGCDPSFRRMTGLDLDREQGLWGSRADPPPEENGGVVRWTMKHVPPVGRDGRLPPTDPSRQFSLTAGFGAEDIVVREAPVGGTCFEGTPRPFHSMSTWPGDPLHANLICRVPVNGADILCSPCGEIDPQTPPCEQGGDTGIFDTYALDAVPCIDGCDPCTTACDVCIDCGSCTTECVRCMDCDPCNDCDPTLCCEVPAAFAPFGGAWDRLSFLTVDEDSHPDPYPDGHRGHGFISDLLLRDRAPLSGRLPLMTVYYRLIGTPGNVSGISFCDATLYRMRRNCTFNGVTDLGTLGFLWPLLSTGNVDGSLTIHAGPVTRPDRPPEPPPAKVYPEPLTSDEVNLRVRVGNALARPGQTEVPLDVFVTADVEYTALVVPIDFDERYLRLARVEDNFLSGTAIIDNEDALPGAQSDEGFVVVASNIGGTRRIAAAGEELHAATVWVDVLDSAAEITETRLASRSVGGRVPNPHVLVRHLSGTQADPVEVTSEVGAVTIAQGLLAIRPSLWARRGDANFDGAFDISDPITVLGHLFLGEEEPLCLRAADQTGDGRLDISDPIRMLDVLFLGASVPGDVEAVRCR